MKSLTAVRKKSPNYPVEFKIKMVELSHGVIRRVGGLEDLFRHETDEQVVIRRVGGLEVNVDAAAFFL